MADSVGIGILIYKNVNLGDWYQSAAAMYMWWKYLNSSQSFSEFILSCIRTNRIGTYPVYWIDRDRMSEFKKPDSCSKIVMICNGWWMAASKGEYDFPPASYICPLFVSVHVANVDLLQSHVIDYFKRHEPIGCRDHSTVKLFEERGVRAYFSGCLTMMLDLRDPLVGFTPSIDYSTTHVFNDAELVIDTTHRDILYAKVTQQGSFPPNPIWIYKSVESNVNLLHAYKVTTKRLHVWLPLMSNRGNVVLWNEAKKRPYESGDGDFFSPHADRFKGLFEFHGDEAGRTAHICDISCRVNKTMDALLDPSLI